MSIVRVLVLILAFSHVVGVRLRPATPPEYVGDRRCVDRFGCGWHGIRGACSLDAAGVAGPITLHWWYLCVCTWYLQLS